MALPIDNRAIALIPSGINVNLLVDPSTSISGKIGIPSNSKPAQEPINIRLRGDKVGLNLASQQGSVGVPRGAVVRVFPENFDLSTLPIPGVSHTGQAVDARGKLVNVKVVVFNPRINPVTEKPLAPPSPPVPKPNPTATKVVLTKERTLTPRPDVLKSTPLIGRSFSQYAIGGKTLPWVERVKGGWMGDMTWSVDGSILSSTFILPNDIIWSHEAATAILGYASRGKLVPGSTTDYFVDRNIPMKHPAFHWMYAIRITKAEGIGVARGGKVVTPDNAGVNVNRGVTQRGTPLDFGNGPFYTPEYFAITVAFETPPFRVAPNEPFGNHLATAAASAATSWYTPGVTTDLLNAEWSRYVIQNLEPSCEFLSHDKQSLMWAAGTPRNGVPFIGNIGWRLEKTRLRWTWVQVPERGLFDSTLGSNVLDAVGKVNSYDFLGSGDAQTYLMEAPRFVPKILPISPAKLGWVATDPYAMPRAFDVELSLVRFNPIPYDTTMRGHNLLPDPLTRQWALAHAAEHYTTATVSGVSGASVTVSSTSGIYLGSVIANVSGVTVPNFAQVQEIVSSTVFKTTKNLTGTGTIKFYLVPYELYDFTKIFKLRG